MTPRTQAPKTPTSTHGNKYPASNDLWNSKLNSNTPITGKNARAFADLAELDSKYNPLRKAAGQILGAELRAALNQKLTAEEEAQIADYGAQIRQACSN